VKFQIVTVKAFYPLLLIVSYKFSIYFQPEQKVRLSVTRGGLYSAIAVSPTMRYGDM